MKSFKQFITESMSQQDWKDLYLKVINGEEYAGYFGLDGKHTEVTVGQKTPYVWISLDKNTVDNGVMFLKDDEWAKLHRLDGPAKFVIKTDRYGKTKIVNYFFIDGQEFTEKEYWKQPEVKLHAQGGNTASSILDI